MEFSRNKTQTRVLFLIRSLEIGGAERQLLTLVRGLDKERFDVTVVSMYAGGTLEAQFRAIPGCTLRSASKSGRWDVAGFGSRLAAIIREARPHIIHGYMGGANEIAWVAGRLARARVIWGIRVSDIDFGSYTWSVGALFRAGQVLARHVDLIICNSEAGRNVHLRAGYPEARTIVIPNGIDADNFRPAAVEGALFRSARSLPADAALIVLPARLDPMKDHPTFLRAAARIAGDWPDLQFLCIGDGPPDYRASLIELARNLGLEGRVQWQPADASPRALYNAAQLVTTCSRFGEGFPNVLGEAMACGTPCITTPSGDAARVVGPTGWIVPFSDPEALAAAWREALSESPDARSSRGRSARDRILREFSIPLLIDRSERVFATLAGMP